MLPGRDNADAGGQRLAPRNDRPITSAGAYSSKSNHPKRRHGNMQRFLKVRYLILGLMCLMYFIAYVDRVNISVAGPLLKDEMGLTPTQLGLVFSAFAYP
jgi:sugar phosphate permease